MKIFKTIWKLYIVILSMAFMLIGIQANAQLELKAKLDSSKMEIGNQSAYHLEITTNKNQTTIWPIYQGGLGSSIEVLEYKEVDTIDNGSQWTLTRELIIAPFDTGYLALSPSFVFVTDGQSIDTLLSEPILLEVYGPQIDTTETFKAIKPIKEEPYTFREILPYILYGVFGLAVLIILIWVVRKLIKKEPLITPIKKPVVPPYTEAIRLLNKLQKKKLWESGEYKMYYTELTDIVRNYIERQLEIPAPEETSEEIISHLEEINLTSQLFTGMKNMFKTADFVKFAKMIPIDDDNEIHLKTAFRFVEEIEEIKIVERKKENES